MQGLFKPKNPHKYKGDVTNIVYRSSYEAKFMLYLDDHPDVAFWASEEFSIPYYNPIKRKVSRYFPDFWVQTTSGKITVVEVKPHVQSQQPKRTLSEAKGNDKRKRRQIIRENVIYMINKAKWDAAKIFCEQRRWDFQIVTEKQLNARMKTTAGDE